jgi:hypothetical protein
MFSEHGEVSLLVFSSSKFFSLFSFKGKSNLENKISFVFGDLNF